MNSAEVNKVIRRIINPTLKENGFSVIKGRTAWNWYGDEYIWVFNIRSVGGYFSSVTGWPPASITVWLGIYYTFLPELGTIKKDDNNVWYPKEWQCHRRSKLTCNYSQLDYTIDLQSNVEKTRNDIWWIQPNGSNIEKAITDINDLLVSYGLKWFKEKSNKELTLKEVKNFNGMHFDTFF